MHSANDLVLLNGLVTLMDMWVDILMDWIAIIESAV